MSHPTDCNYKMSSSLFVLQIMENLDSQAALLHGEVIYALSDDSIDVIEGILPNLKDILKKFVEAKLISPESMVSKLFMFLYNEF